MLAVSIGTYLIVFNLNIIANSGKRQYSRLRKGIIHRMSKDDRENFKSKGDMFQEYEANAINHTSKPSEWWISAYLLLKIVIYPVRYAVSLKKYVLLLFP
jgi:hypothetical protein